MSDGSCVVVDFGVVDLVARLDLVGSGADLHVSVWSREESASGASGRGLLGFEIVGDWVVLFGVESQFLPGGGGLSGASLLFFGTFDRLAPVGSHDAVPSGVVNSLTGLGLNISGQSGSLFAVIEFDGAVEALLVAWHHGVLNLGPGKNFGTVWDVTARDGVTNEDLLDTSELEPSIGTIEHAWGGLSNGSECNWLLSGGEPVTNGGKCLLSVRIFIVVVIVFFILFIHGASDGDEQGGDITVHCVYRNSLN